MISDFPPDFKPFRLVKMCDILTKLNGQAFLKIMWLSAVLEWTFVYTKLHISNIMISNPVVNGFHINSKY